MSETPGLKRDSTMAVTAQEGEAFLENQGMKVTEDEAKTRAQKEKLDEIEKEEEKEEDEKEEKEEDEGGEPAKVTRTGTMVATAEEGTRLLDGSGELGGTRSQTAVVKETEEESKMDTTTEEETTAKPAVVRDSTMVTTAQEGAALLEGEKLEKTRGQTKEAAAAVTASKTTPTKVKRSTTIAKTAEDSTQILGSEERGRTRSQTRRMSERDQVEEEGTAKPAVKRTSTMAQTAKEGEEFLERQSAKQAKLDENGDEPSSTTATATEDATQAEA